MLFILVFLSLSGFFAENDSSSFPLQSIDGADMSLYSIYEDCYESDIDKSMTYAEVFLEGIDSSAVNLEVAMMCDRLSEWYYKDKNDFLSAIRWKNRALSQYVSLGHEKDAGDVRYGLAKLYYRRGEFHLSLRYLTESLPVFVKHSDTVSVMECHNLLGGVYFACGDYGSAFDYFQKYAEESRARNDSVRLCVALNNLAAYYSIKEDTLRTVKFIEEAIDISRRINDSLMICRSYLNLSSLNINNGRLADAEECLLAARGLTDNLSFKGQYWFNWCLLLRKQGNIDAANDSLVKAVECFTKLGDDIELRKCYSLMINNYGLISDTLAMCRAAWDYYNVSERISGMEADVQLFQYQNEIIRQKETEKKVERRAIINIYITVSLCALSLICMGIWLYARNRSFVMRRKEDELEKQILLNKKNEQELNSKNEILEIKKLEQYKTERIVLEMTDRFRELCRETKDKTTCNKIMQICSEISHSIEKDMDEINNYIPEFNSVFFQRLLKDFPDLTVNERRLCALLNMNLSTKEISEITRQSTHSINIARGRLRNKLGLKGSQLSLYEFLATYSSFGDVL